MRTRLALVVATAATVSFVGLAAPASSATNSSATHPAVNLSRPFIPYKGTSKPVEGPKGIGVSYSSNWSGYAALPKKAGETFTSIVADYSVPSVNCADSPNTFSYHWIGLDGWADATVEQDGVAADCDGTTPEYAAWFEMYPANFSFSFRVKPGDAIESAVHYLGHRKYELSLKDVTLGKSFDLTETCPVKVCANTSAEAITEAYYYNKNYAGTSDFGNENYGDVTLTNSDGLAGGLYDPTLWKTGEGIALGEYGDVDTTPGPIATVSGYSPSAAFSVFWSREN